MSNSSCIGEIIAVHFRAKVAAEIYFLRIPCDGEATVGVNSFKATQVEHLCGLQPESLLNSLQVQIRFKFLFELTSFGGWIDFDAFKVGRTGLFVYRFLDDFDAFKVGRRDRIITYWFMISHRELVVKVNPFVTSRDLLRRVFAMSELQLDYLQGGDTGSMCDDLDVQVSSYSTTGQGFQISLEGRNYAQSASGSEDRIEYTYLRSKICLDFRERFNTEHERFNTVNNTSLCNRDSASVQHQHSLFLERPAPSGHLGLSRHHGPSKARHIDLLLSRRLYSVFTEIKPTALAN
ncbi:hypothetical protein C8R43DRAFT_1136834 [Mycena crocata]|nr:hypothetical protein C8R43DRAFT_1136834 [Mycena crocata]